MGFSLVSLYWPLSVPTEGSSQRELLCPCSFTSSPVVSWLLQPRAAASLDHSTSWPHVGDEGKHPPLGKEGVKRGQKNTKHSGDKWLVLTVGGYGPGLCSPDQWHVRRCCESSGRGVLGLVTPGFLHRNMCLHLLEGPLFSPGWLFLSSMVLDGPRLLLD